MREGKGPPRKGTLNKGLKSRVHVYSEWMHVSTRANSMSWHHVPMKTKSHANAKSQEYYFWLFKSTESVGSMYVPVACMRLVKSYIWFSLERERELSGGCSFRKQLTSHPADLTNFCRWKVQQGRDYSCSPMGWVHLWPAKKNKGSQGTGLWEKGGVWVINPSLSKVCERIEAEMAYLGHRQPSAKISKRGRLGMVVIRCWEIPFLSSQVAGSGKLSFRVSGGLVRRWSGLLERILLHSDQEARVTLGTYAKSRVSSFDSPAALQWEVWESVSWLSASKFLFIMYFFWLGTNTTNRLV